MKCIHCFNDMVELDSGGMLKQYHCEPCGYTRFVGLFVGLLYIAGTTSEYFKDYSTAPNIQVIRFSQKGESRLISGGKMIEVSRVLTDDEVRRLIKGNNVERLFHWE